MFKQNARQNKKNIFVIYISFSKVIIKIYTTTNSLPITFFSKKFRRMFSLLYETMFVQNVATLRKKIFYNKPVCRFKKKSNTGNKNLIYFISFGALPWINNFPRLISFHATILKLKFKKYKYLVLQLCNKPSQWFYDWFIDSRENNFHNKQTWVIKSVDDKSWYILFSMSFGHVKIRL